MKMKLKIVFDLKYQIILSTTDKRTSFILGGICVVFIVFHYLLQVQFLSSFKITKLMIEKASRKIFFSHFTLYRATSTRILQFMKRYLEPPVLNYFLLFTK